MSCYQKSKIQEPNSNDNEGYGVYVNIVNDTMLVSAAGRGKGDELEPFGKGAVYAYRKIAGNWVLEQIIENNDVNFGFGFSLSLGQNRALISAPRENNGKGKVYVYEYSNGQWQKTHTIVPPYATVSNPDAFGGFVLLKGDTAFISEQYSSNTNYRSGRVYVYKLVNNSWVLAQELKADPAGGYTYFGSFIAEKDGRLFVGSYDGLQLNPLWVLDEINGQWVHTSKIIPADGELGDSFSRRIYPVSANRIIVSTVKDKASNGKKTGSFSIFDYDSNSSSWQLFAKVFPPGANPESKTYFVSGLAVVGEDLFVSTPYADEVAINSGTIYHYRLNKNSIQYRGLIKMNQPLSRSRFGTSLLVENNNIWVNTYKDKGTGSVIRFENDIIFTSSFE